MMTPADAEKILNALRDDWKMQGWTDTDVMQGNLYIAIILNDFMRRDFPIHEPKFADMLRSLASAMDIVRDFHNPKN